MLPKLSHLSVSIEPVSRLRHWCSSEYLRISQTFDIDFINRTPEASRIDTVGMSGGFGLMRWKRRVSPKSEFALLTYFTQEKRNEFYGQAQFQAAEADFQHRYRFASRHDFMWGAGYRLYRDNIGGPNTLCW